MRYRATKPLKFQIFTYHSTLQLIDKLTVPGDFLFLFHIDLRNVNRNGSIGLLDCSLYVVGEAIDTLLGIFLALQGRHVDLSHDQRQALKSVLRLLVSFLFALHYKLCQSLPGKFKLIIYQT